MDLKSIEIFEKIRDFNENPDFRDNSLQVDINSHPTTHIDSIDSSIGNQSRRVMHFAFFYDTFHMGK